MRKVLSLLLFVLSLVSAAAHADTITFSLSAPIQTGAPGQTLSFDATVTAASTNTGNIYMDALDVNAQDGLVPYTDDFFNNFPLFLAPGDTFTGQLFQILLRSDLPSAFSLSGVATLQGRFGQADQADLTSQPFLIQSTVAPEPSTFCLLLTGLATCGICMGRRRMPH